MRSMVSVESRQARQGGVRWWGFSVEVHGVAVFRYWPVPLVYADVHHAQQLWCLYGFHIGTIRSKGRSPDPGDGSS